MSAGTQRFLFVRRAARGLLLVAISVLTICGIAAIAGEVYYWHSGIRWRPEDINILIASDSPTRALAYRVWEDIKFLIQYGALFIGAVAFAVAVTHIKTVARLISDFIVARGPIYALGSTITQVETSVAVLSRDVDRLSALEPKINQMAEKIEETFAQIANLQRQAVSQRTEAATDEEASPARNGPVAIESPSTEERNWERLRELWNANGERLDRVIERIADKRRRARFQRMPRTNYPAIIDALAAQGIISEAARKASLDLHSTFMSYKPRNRIIPDAAVAAVEVFDRMLEQELGPPSDDEPPTQPPSGGDRGAPVTA